MATGLFHDLIDDELGIPADLELLDSQFDYNLDPVYRGLVFHHIVGRWEVQADCILHVHLEGGDDNQFDPYASPYQ